MCMAFHTLTLKKKFSHTQEAGEKRQNHSVEIGGRKEEGGTVIQGRKEQRQKKNISRDLKDADAIFSPLPPPPTPNPPSPLSDASGEKRRGGRVESTSFPPILNTRSGGMKSYHHMNRSQMKIGLRRRRRRRRRRRQICTEMAIGRGRRKEDHV